MTRWTFETGVERDEAKGVVATHGGDQRAVFMPAADYDEAECMQQLRLWIDERERTEVTT